MKKRNTAAVSLATIATFGLALTSWAQLPQFPERGTFGIPNPLPQVGDKEIGQLPTVRPGGLDDAEERSPFGRLGRILDLTEAQLSAAQALVDAHRIATQALWDQAAAAREVLQTQLREGTDPITIGNAVLASRALQAQLQEANDVLRANLRNLLTPDQQDLLDTINELRGEREGQVRRPIGRLGVQGLGAGVPQED